MESAFTAIQGKPAQLSAELNRTTRRLEAFHHDLSTVVACGSGILLNLPGHPLDLPLSPMFLGAPFHSCFTDSL